MKHIKLFEEWSPEFNKTLQGAYNKAQTTNKGFGKAAKSVMDYANRSISQEVFSAESKNGDKITFTHNPEFILKPVENFKKHNFGKIFGGHWYFLIPIIIKSGEFFGTGFVKERKGMISFNINVNQGVGNIGNMFIFPTIDFVDLGNWEDTDSNPQNIYYDAIKRNQYEHRFSDRKSIENFVAMTIQAILSSKEDESSSKSIIETIQRVILDRDMRQFTM